MTKELSSHSLVVIVVDVSPLAWGEREMKRTAQDKARVAAGKRSVGPAILDEVLESIQALASAVLNIEREAGLLIIGVADNESAVVYPRKPMLNEWLAHPETYAADTRRLRGDLIGGVAELVVRASKKPSTARSRQAAMAAGYSLALCLINRFLVAARAGGVSALQAEHYLNRSEDDGVIALIGGRSSRRKAKTGRVWSPRILLVQASEDRPSDYNAFMNCAFASVKQHIVVDGCFLQSGSSYTSSPFLEQACDLTSGVFLSPSGAAQVDGALTEVLYSVFLAPLTCRSTLNLPASNKVDFRARCFETATMVDKASVCNQCLSIFKNRPKGHCPTCQATILDKKSKST